MAKKKPREGYKLSNGHEVKLGHRWDLKLEKQVKETRGGKPMGPTSRTIVTSFGISQIDSDDLDKTCAKKDAPSRGTLLYQFFTEGMSRLKQGKTKARASVATARPVVTMVSVDHIDDLELVREAWKIGVVVITPDLNSSVVRRGLPDRLFDDATVQLVRHSDAVLLGKGAAKSKASNEIRSEAQSVGIPVFATLAQLSKWMTSTRAGNKRAA